MSNLSSGNKVDELTIQLRNAILTGIYPPGTIFYQEALAEEFNVSRTPIREALRKLEYEGFVETGKRRQFKVRKINYQNIIQLYRVREVIDGLGARILAEKKDENGIQNTVKELENILEEMGFTIEEWDPENWSRLNIKFHSTIINATDNEPLINQLPILYMSTELFFPTVITKPSRASSALDEHRLILNSIWKGQPDLAENVARFHIRSALNAIEESPGNNSE